MNHLFYSLPEDIYVKLINETDIAINGQDLMLMQAYIPGIEESNNKKTDITIKIHNRVEKGLTVKDQSIELYENWQEKLQLDFFHLFYSICRNEFIKKKLFPVHSICLEAQKNILVVGHSGFGKTSIALELIHSFDVKLFSGNKTLVKFKDNEMSAIAGTKTITKRSNSNSNDNFNRKVFKLADENYSRKKSLKIDAIIIAKLNDGVEEIEKLSSMSALHKLFPFFLDQMNAHTIMCDSEFIYCDDIKTEQLTYLSKNLKTSLEKIPVYETNGSMSFITNILTKL